MTVLVLLFWLAVLFLPLISLWRLFEMAGQSGWSLILPVYNLFIMTQIAGLGWWWVFIPFLAFFIPYLGIPLMIILFFYIMLKFIESYGKDSLFALGAFLLPFIFLPVLAFDPKTKYIGPAAKTKIESQDTKYTPENHTDSTPDDINIPEQPEHSEPVQHNEPLDSHTNIDTNNDYHNDSTNIDSTNVN